MVKNNGGKKWNPGEYDSLTDKQCKKINRWYYIGDQR